MSRGHILEFEHEEDRRCFLDEDYSHMEFVEAFSIESEEF